MMEWLSSKMAVALAATLMLSSVTACFLSQKGHSENEELESVARNLAAFVDNALSLPGTVTLTVAYGGDGDLILPSSVGGSAYRVQLRRDSVVVEQGAARAIGHWSGELHFWQWDGKPTDWAKIDQLDGEWQSLALSPGERFHISIEIITVNHADTLLGFAQPAS